MIAIHYQQDDMIEIMKSCGDDAGFHGDDAVEVFDETWDGFQVSFCLDKLSANRFATLKAACRAAFLSAYGD